ncbi:DinB family protein [Glutamicibacter endophyticus]
MSQSPKRWTQATVYPDMWVNPDQDPRETEQPIEGERATLEDFLRNYRLTLLMKCEGLSPEQLAQRSVPPSTLSLLGLLRHLAEVERDWRGWVTPGGPETKIYGPKDADFNDVRPDPQLVQDAYADLEREQEATDALLAQFTDLGARLDPSQVSLRELMVHRVEEYARHCGHADLLRECVDGRVGQ